MQGAWFYLIFVLAHGSFDPPFSSVKNLRGTRNLMSAMLLAAESGE